MTCGLVKQLPSTTTKPSNPLYDLKNPNPPPDQHPSQRPPTNLHYYMPILTPPTNLNTMTHADLDLGGIGGKIKEEEKSHTEREREREREREI